jgi:hypothetical protein
MIMSFFQESMFLNYLLHLFAGVDHSIRRYGVNLPYDQRFGAYYSLKVIKRTEKKSSEKDKELVASLLSIVI